MTSFPPQKVLARYPRQVAVYLWRTLGILLCLLLSGCSMSDASETSEGQAVYAQYCASCHGVSGEGQTDWQTLNPDGSLRAPPHNDSGHTWHHPDADLLMVIQNGRNQMPAFRDTLTPAQQEAVLDYIKTFWSPDTLEVQADVTRQWNDQHGEAP